MRYNGVTLRSLPEESSDRSEKAMSQGPQFVSGVIMKISDNKPLAGRKFIKVQNLCIYTFLLRTSQCCFVLDLPKAVESHLGMKLSGLENQRCH